MGLPHDGNGSRRRWPLGPPGIGMDTLHNRKADPQHSRALHVRLRIPTPHSSLSGSRTMRTVGTQWLVSVMHGLPRNDAAQCYWAVGSPIAAGALPDTTAGSNAVVRTVSITTPGAVCRTVAMALPA